MSSGNIDIGYQDRRSLNETAKHNIARTCAARIPNGSSVFLNFGTSTEVVASALLEHQNLLVATNNMNVAQILATQDDCRVIVTGGSLHRTAQARIGSLSEIDTTYTDLPLSASLMELCQGWNTQVSLPST